MAILDENGVDYSSCNPDDILSSKFKGFADQMTVKLSLRISMIGDILVKWLKRSRNSKVLWWIQKFLIKH